MAGGCSCFDGMMVSVMAYSIVDFGKTSNGGGRRARLLFGGLDALANERPVRFTAFGPQRGPRVPFVMSAVCAAAAGCLASSRDPLSANP